MATFECDNCGHENEAELSSEPFAAAILAFDRRRFIDLLDELELALPSEFVGLADDILKWAGKSR